VSTGSISVENRALAAPFGGVSLAELRSSAAAQRDAEAVMLAALPGWNQPRSAAEPSFDEVLFADVDESAEWVEPVTWQSVAWDEDDEDGLGPRRRSKGRRALILTVGTLVPLALGALVFLGLLWTTSPVSAPPDWIPQALWFGPWAK
jgi:hypothetical protein